jgi:arginyl-tRNA synthetase
VESLAALVEGRLGRAMFAELPGEITDADPQLRPSDFADYQVNGILPLAKLLHTDPRRLAGRVAEAVGTDELIGACEVSGPGFLNITLTDAALLRQVAHRAVHGRLGIPGAATGGVAVVDYSQPNIAKEMHVGHLRSTIIGDALVRCLEFAGAKVVRQNHIGDWGTQFGMLIQYLFEHPTAQNEHADGGQTISRLGELYRDARAAFEADTAFADRARARVVALQAGDEQTLARWRNIVAESAIYFNDVYGRLDVLLTDDDLAGESTYNPYLQEVCDDLEQRGIAVRSDGALCVFFDDIRGPDGEPVPLIVQKADGGFGYATTDLAAIRHRVGVLGADRILYVVDSRQALHFRMVFAAARRAGYLPEHVEAVHVQFGSVLGPDGRPFKTRAGDTVRLISLLDEAVAHARQTVREKSPDLDPVALDERSREVGIGAVKYADLSTSRTRDYLFDMDRMLALTGNTAVYLQYAHARVRSILAKATTQSIVDVQVIDTVALAPAERRLALLLDDLSATLDAVVADYEPHRLCTYMFAVAQAFSDFFETCPVLKAPDDVTRANRLMLCQLTGDTLRMGLGLLGIRAPQRL